MATDGVRVLGLTGVLDALRQLPQEVVSKGGGIIRPALRKGGLVLLKQAQENVQRIVDEVNKDGRMVSTGLAKKSLRVKRVKPLNGQNGEAFIVAVKTATYDGRQFNRKNKSGKKSGKSVALRTNDVLFMLEAGTETRRPMPWMRPAFDSKKDQALATFVAEAAKGLERVQKKLDKIAAAKAKQR
jgi:HK97 gp10 family phage protein